MTPRYTRQDVFRTTYEMVDLGHIFEAQFLLKYYERVGYNAGEQWNYDIYDINGKRFLYGDRTPDLKNNYSTEILKKCGREAQKLSWTDPDYQKKADKLMQEFCDSIDKGIHDPSPVTSFANFRRQLVEQKKMFPQKSLTDIAKELYNEIPYKKKDEVKVSIDAGFHKIMEKYAGLMSKAKPGMEMEACLKQVEIEGKHLLKNKENKRQKEEPGRSM